MKILNELNEKFTANACLVIELSKVFAENYRCEYVQSIHLIAAINNVDCAAKYMLEARHFNGEIISMHLQESVDQTKGVRKEDWGTKFSPRVIKILEEAYRNAESEAYNMVGTLHILYALIVDDSNIINEILADSNIKRQSLASKIEIQLNNKENYNPFKKIETEKKGTPLGFLMKFSKDLTQMALDGRLDPIIGREEETKSLIRTLSRRLKNNPCLVGEAGVGKTAIVEGLAMRIANEAVPNTLRGKKILALNLSSVVAGTKYRGEFEARLEKIIRVVEERGDIILFLDEIHTLIGTGGAESSQNAANIIKPSLARGGIQIIGATTSEEYRKHFEVDSALERRFQPVRVEETTEEETIEILDGIKKKYEKFHDIEFTDEAIKAAVKLSKRYINDRKLPDKAIDIIDEVGAASKIINNKLETHINELIVEKNIWKAKFDDVLMAENVTACRKARNKLSAINKKIAELNRKEQKIIITENDVAAIISQMSGIPVAKIAQKEGDKLRNLEKDISKKVIGQNEAVDVIAKAIKRGRVGIQDPNKPIGSFLFLGPTGVGKTELSRVIAEMVYGTEQSMIRIDMSEYMEAHSASKLVGAPPGYLGYDAGGQLTEKVRKYPYSVLLFDEVEKAHPDVFNILLQVLDEGHITDSKGRKINFKNTIIIMTSNAGAMKIVEPKNLGFSSNVSKEDEHERMKAGVMDEVKKFFKPEFLNRIDEVVVFHSLDKQDFNKIIGLLTDKLAVRCENQMKLKLKFTSKLKKYLVEKYSNVKMGARPLRRGIQTAIEDELALEILNGNIKEGDNITVDVSKEKVVFKIAKQSIADEKNK